MSAANNFAALGRSDTVTPRLFSSPVSELKENPFALAYPGQQIAKLILFIVYAPGIAGILLFVLGMIPGWNVSALLPLYSIGMGYGIIAGIIWIYRLLAIRVDTVSRTYAYLAASSLVIGWLPNTLATGGFIDMGGNEGLTNLSLVFLPLCFALVYRKIV